MAEAGVLRCEVYDSTDARWNVLPVKGRRLPVPASYDLESDFTTSLRKLESEVVLDDPASRPTEGGSETLRLPPGRDKTIGKWINSVRSGSPHLTATSGSEDLVSLASATTQRTSTAASAASAAPVSHVIPSQANGSPHVESKQVKCGQSHALSPTRTPAERHEHPRTARPASTKSSQDRIEDNKLFLESFRPPSNVPQHRPQPHGQPPKSQKASEASVTVAPASQPKPKPPQPAASKAQAGAGINRFTLIDLPDEDTESSSTGPSSVPPPGYEITGADENNVPTQQSDSHLNSQRSLLDDDDDMRRDTENTGFTEVSRQKKASNTRSSTSKPASRRVMVKGKGGLVERLADDDTEPRRVYWNTKHPKPGPAKGKSSKQTTTASATLKNLKAGFELPTAPPSNTSTPQKANTVTEPQTRPPAPQPCSSKLLACIKSSLEDARMHRGLVESRFELGKVLMHNDRSIEEGANWDQIKTDILERSNGFKANYGAFSPAITSRVRDITALLAHFKISEVVSEQAQWHLTCSTTDQKEMNLIVDARNTQAEPYISNERILGATYMHHPQRAHDARWVMRGACRRNIESIEGASDLFSTLQTPEWTSPSSDSSADITYPALHGRDTPALFVHATQLHVTKRYLTDTHNPNQHLQITRIIEMLISRGNPSYGGDANRFQTHCQPYETLVAPEAESPLWYELSLHDERFDIIADNSTLSLGQRAAWSVEERLTDEIKAGLGALEALSGRFVEVMDGVGHENRGMGWVINRSIKEKRVKRDAEKAGKILNAPAVDGLW